MPSDRTKYKPWSDPNHAGNGPEHRTGKECIDCDQPAGTAWSPLWCFGCNVKRMERLDRGFEALETWMRKREEATNAPHP